MLKLHLLFTALLVGLAWCQSQEGLVGLEEPEEEGLIPLDIDIDAAPVTGGAGEAKLAAHHGQGYQCHRGAAGRREACCGCPTGSLVKSRVRIMAKIYLELLQAHNFADAQNFLLPKKAPTMVAACDESCCNMPDFTAFYDFWQFSQPYEMGPLEIGQPARDGSYPVEIEINFATNQTVSIPMVLRMRWIQEESEACNLKLSAVGLVDFRCKEEQVPRCKVCQVGCVDYAVALNETTTIYTTVTTTVTDIIKNAVVITTSHATTWHKDVAEANETRSWYTKAGEEVEEEKVTRTWHNPAAAEEEKVTRTWHNPAADAGEEKITRTWHNPAAGNQKVTRTWHVPAEEQKVTRQTTWHKNPLPTGSTNDAALIKALAEQQQNHRKPRRPCNRRCPKSSYSSSWPSWESSSSSSCSWRRRSSSSSSRCWSSSSSSSWSCRRCPIKEGPRIAKDKSQHYIDLLIRRNPIAASYLQSPDFHPQDPMYKCEGSPHTCYTAYGAPQLEAFSQMTYPFQRGPIQRSFYNPDGTITTVTEVEFYYEIEGIWAFSANVWLTWAWEKGCELMLVESVMTDVRCKFEGTPTVRDCCPTVGTTTNTISQISTTITITSTVTSTAQPP